GDVSHRELGNVAGAVVCVDSDPADRQKADGPDTQVGGTAVVSGEGHGVRATRVGSVTSDHGGPNKRTGADDAVEDEGAVALGGGDGAVAGAGGGPVGEGGGGGQGDAGRDGDGGELLGKAHGLFLLENRCMEEKESAGFATCSPPAKATR